MCSIMLDPVELQYDAVKGLPRLPSISMPPENLSIEGASEMRDIEQGAAARNEGWGRSAKVTLSQPLHASLALTFCAASHTMDSQISGIAFQGNTWKKEKLSFVTHSISIRCNLFFFYKRGFSQTHNF